MPAVSSTATSSACASAAPYHVQYASKTCQTKHKSRTNINKQTLCTHRSDARRFKHSHQVRCRLRLGRIVALFERGPGRRLLEVLVTTAGDGQDGFQGGMEAQLLVCPAGKVYDTGRWLGLL